MNFLFGVVFLLVSLTWSWYWGTSTLSPAELRHEFGRDFLIGLLIGTFISLALMIQSVRVGTLHRSHLRSYTFIIICCIIIFPVLTLAGWATWRMAQTLT